MPKKIVYGLNHEQYEAALTKAITDAGIDAIVLKTVTYREAILNVLPGSGTDVLIFRDTLEGSMDTSKLLEQVRMDYPSVQIILICSVDSSSPLLAKCASLGIYDVINSDAVSPKTIVEHIQHPGTFRDVYQYYNFSSPDMVPSDVKEKQEAEAAAAQSRPNRRRGGLLGGLFGRGGDDKPVAEAPQGAALVVPEGVRELEKPALDQKLVRETIEESATRRAQKDMDALIEKAVTEKVTEYEEKYKAFEAEISDSHHLISQKESQISSLMRELADEKSAHEALETEYRQEKEQHLSDLSAYEEQLNALKSKDGTPQWYAEQEQKWETERLRREEELGELRSELAEKTASLEELRGQMENAEAQAPGAMLAELDELRAKLASFENIVPAPDSDMERKLADSLRESNFLRAQLEEAKRVETELRSGYDGRIASAVAENESLRCQLNQLSAEICPMPELPAIPAEGSMPEPSGPAKTYVVLGSKHGVGNSTVAMNLAAGFAVEGHKTLLIEVDDSFPLTNEFFELASLPVGLYDALRASGAGKTDVVESAIVRFDSIRPANNGIAKSYKRLPSGFHVLTSSNKELLSRSKGVAHKADAAQVRNLVQILENDQHYARIVFDIQPNDRDILESLVKSGIQIDRLIVTASQDPHSIGSAGVLVSNLAKWRASSLLASMLFVITRYDASVRLSAAKIAKYLDMEESRFVTLSSDNAGYIDAAADGVPYILRGGKNAGEFEKLRARCNV